MGSQAIPRVRRPPLHGFRRLGVGSDRAHAFAFQIVPGREDAPGDDVAIELREPELHVGEPGGVGRREGQRHIRMGLHDGVDVFGLMRGEIVEDDVDRGGTPLMGHDGGQEGDELGRRVPFGGAPAHLASARIERGVERQRPVAEVLNAVAFGAPGRPRQHRIQAIECRDGRLLIDTEDGGMLRRVQVEPDDVGGLAFERRGIGGHLAHRADAASSRAAPRRGRPAYARPRGPCPTVACSSASSRPAACPVKTPGFELRREHRRRLPPVPAYRARPDARPQNVHASARYRCHCSPPLNPCSTRALSEPHQTAGSSGFIGSAFATAHTTFQFLPFHGGQGHGIPRGRHVDTTASVVTVHSCTTCFLRPGFLVSVHLLLMAHDDAQANREPTIFRECLRKGLQDSCSVPLRLYPMLGSSSIVSMVSW